MIVWIDALAAGSAPVIFGLSLLERHLHGLRNLKPAPSRVVIDLPTGAAEPRLGGARILRKSSWIDGMSSIKRTRSDCISVVSVPSVFSQRQV